MHKDNINKIPKTAISLHTHKDNINKTQMAQSNLNNKSMFGSYQGIGKGNTKGMLRNTNGYYDGKIPKVCQKLNLGPQLSQKFCNFPIRSYASATARSHS